jgi:hypothetical protein
MLVATITSIASGSVRKCEPFSPVTDCPACGLVSSFPAQVEGEFVRRECPCSFQWRQFSSNG